MRVPRRGTPIQPLTYMWERHKEIARLQVTGLKPIEIAKKLGMTTCRLSLIMNSPVYKEYLATLSGARDEKAIDIQKEMEKGAELGVVKLVEYLDADNETVPPKLKAQIAQDFLDRTGYGKTSKVEETHKHILTTDRIERLKEEQRKLLGGLVVEVVNG